MESSGILMNSATFVSGLPILPGFPRIDGIWQPVYIAPVIPVDDQEAYVMSSPATSSADAVDQVAEPAEIQLTIELGRTSLEHAIAQQLRPGALIALDEFANDPVAIYRGERLVGRGEVLLIDGQLGVRITELFIPNAETCV